MRTSLKPVLLLAVLCCVVLSCLAAPGNNNGNPSWSVKVPKKFHPRSFTDTSGPAQPGSADKKHWVADFVVVGSGAGGASVARGLLDGGFSVIILEAGDYYDDNEDVWNPERASNTYGSMTPTYGWQMKSAVEDATGRAYQVNLAMMWGGSTSHNGMQYVRASRAYYDEMATFGGSAWSADNVYDTFQEMERYIDEETGTVLPGRGSSGPVDVRRPATGPSEGLGSLAYKLAQWSSEASGIPISPDYNGATQPYGPIPRFDVFQTPNRTRTSASSAFLGPNIVTKQGLPVGNKKIRAFFKSHVVKVLFDKNKKAVAVDVAREGYTERIWAKKEVILSANIRSSQILENSGVGDSAYLSSLGIPVVYNNPNVGKHLNNHPSAIHIFSTNVADGGISTPEDPRSLYAGGGFFPSINADGQFEECDITKPRMFQTLWLNVGPGLVGYFTMIARPVSLGESHTQSTNPFQIPLLKEGTFAEGDDLEQYGRFLYYFVQNNLTATMAAHDPAYQPLWYPLWNSVNDAKEWLKANSIKSSHYVGLNRMAPSAATGVVDYAGRVFGVTGLRVVDTSILPTITDGNCGAPGMMIGTHIARMIRDYYN